MSCQSNLKQIALACAQYSQDTDGHLPPVAVGTLGWVQVMTPYTLGSWPVYHCPSGEQPASQPSSDYFINARVAGRFKSQLPSGPQTILMGDGIDNGVTSSHFSKLPPQWISDEDSPARRHLDGANYAWVDGHVKWLRPEKVTTLSPLQHPKVAATFAVR